MHDQAKIYEKWIVLILLAKKTHVFRVCVGWTSFMTTRAIANIVKIISISPAVIWTSLAIIFEVIVKIIASANI